MNHMNLSDELRNQLLEAASWGKVGITPRLNETRDPGDEEETEETEEAIEEAIHACPLCASQLDESIDEERLLEHLNVVMGLVDRLSQLHEGDEDIDAVIDETLSELLLDLPEEQEEDYYEEDTAKKKEPKKKETKKKTYYTSKGRPSEVFRGGNWEGEQ